MLSANRRVSGRALMRTICPEVAENGYVEVNVLSSAYVCGLLTHLHVAIFHFAFVLL